MLRQLAKATSRRQHVIQQALKPHSPALAACMSTAPKRTQNISFSYEEWAAKNAASKMLPTKKNTPRIRQHPSTTNKPSRYNCLVHLPENASLHFPSDHKHNHFQLECVDFAITKPGKGGHVVLGRNGSGKSLLVQQLAAQSAFAKHEDWKVPSPKDIAYVSFDSHLQVLQDHPHQTVHECITGGTGNLSKAAQFLVVRFGLFPLLHRTLSTLSTGEIRKSLVVGALAKQPTLLILENPFDGLDVQAREELRSIVSKTIQGLGESSKLLVQHVNAEYVPPAQVLLSTHRPEEIVNEISSVSYVDQQDGNNVLRTISRPSGHSQEQIMFQALGLDKDHNKNTNWAVVAPWEDTSDPTLPSEQEIQQVWSTVEKKNDDDNSLLLFLENVTIRRRRDGVATEDGDGQEQENDNNSEFATLLHPLTWEVAKGQRWLIAGGNGAGKSTLSRFLLQQSNSSNAQEAVAVDDTTQDLLSGIYQKEQETDIGWVSTESHLGQVNGDNAAATAWDVIGHNGTVPESVVETVVQWVFGHAANPNMLQERALQDLSQGEQKLALIASALALRPKLLILDEPTQGLDWVHRRRILALLERLCQANPDLSLAFITHYAEEWIPSISHVLHLDKGRAKFQGDRKQYNPNKLG